MRKSFIFFVILIIVAILFVVRSFLVSNRFKYTDLNQANESNTAQILPVTELEMQEIHEKENRENAAKSVAEKAALEAGPETKMLFLAEYKGYRYYLSWQEIAGENRYESVYNKNIDEPTDLVRVKNGKTEQVSRLSLKRSNGSFSILCEEETIEAYNNDYSGKTYNAIKAACANQRVPIVYITHNLGDSGAMNIVKINLDTSEVTTN